MDIVSPTATIPSVTLATERKILILANPISGGGRSLKVHSQVRPHFDSAAVKYEFRTTEKVGHAFELARDCDVTLFKAIVCISGDGMFYEVINGLRARQDAHEVFQKLTLGVIPAGTGNGLAMSFGFARDPVLAAKAILQNTVSPLDLLVVKGSDGKELATASLSVSWGFIGDHDNLTERRYRWMGPALATSIAPIVCLLGRNIYRGTISFIPTGAVTSKRGMKFETNDEWVTIEGEFWGFTACNTTHLATDVHMAPAAKLNSGSMELVIMHACGTFDMVSILTKLDEGKHIDHPFVDVFQVKTLKLVPENPGQGFIAVDGELFPSQTIVVDTAPSHASVYVHRAGEGKSL